MKLLVFCTIVIANISNNGKASLDSFSPAHTNILLEDTTKNSDASCHRPCKLNVKPRRCYYNFKIEPSILEDSKPAITINGLSPGPPINVCVNDIIVVEVQNKVPDQDLAIHWHGIEQKGTPYMDGVPMITQCPIAYGSTYKYAFIASTPGTFFYHSDSVSHQSDGVYGPLIVNQPQPLEPHSSLYDYDRSQEHTLVVAAKFPELLTGNLEDSSTAPSGLVINGGDSFKMFMMPGFAYRLRFINAIALECPVLMSVDSHEMTVIATDGKPVKPMAAKNALLYPGERMDVVVRVGAAADGYWVRARGAGACAGLAADALFLHAGYNYTALLDSQKNALVNNEDAISGQSLNSLQDVSPSKEVESYYLGIDKNIVEFQDSDNDFRYISDGLPKKPFFPATLSLRETGVVQINNKSFLYPSTPLLLKPDEPQDKQEMSCVVGEEAEINDPQCLQYLNVQVGDTIELALVNEGFGSNESYTFHMHGYPMQVLGTGKNTENAALSKERFQKLDEAGAITRNLINPPIKDTITVPNKGYAVVRIRPDHGGSWLLECRACGFFSLPAAIVINVQQTIPRKIINSLPKCGSYKPPDVLLN